MTAANLKSAQEMGLTDTEYNRIKRILGRSPNYTELGLFSAMWSEHCSYKSSRKWLSKLPTEAPWVICGPGENAGVVDIGDGLALVFKMESHNHPSYIEPYQGAATGVGGILRDIFTMGARPIASLNCLRFGHEDHPKTRYLLDGVVAGIGGYGNCMGIPTVGGECTFDARYDGNILVNAMSVGVAAADGIFYARATGVDSPVVYVGSKTGRDGIHGATMASASFDEDSQDKRPTVQVGDPFTEKRLLEACLELMSSDAITGIQDMGAAGLTSSAIEMASKGEGGIELDMDLVPRREEGMTPYELMLSESQERMLMVLRPGSEAQARRVFEKWELDFSIIGRVTESDHIVLKTGGKVAASAPVKPLADGVSYERPWVEPPMPPQLPALPVPLPAPLETLSKMLGSKDLASRQWIWEQYDHSVMANTITGPGSDSAVIRIHSSNKAIAVSADCTPRYCMAAPKLGGAQAVAECWRNLTCVGARPLAITDCLNFGNPEKPEIMGQFVQAIEGMAEACRALDFPVVSGNVSFYNETENSNIPPTPQIGGVGILEDIHLRCDLALTAQCDSLLLVGGAPKHLGQSLFVRHILDGDFGPPPQVDLALEQKNGDFVRQLIKDQLLTACHDISDGGLLVAIAEMCMAGNRGITLEGEETPNWLFGEDQARYILASTKEAARTISQKASKTGVSLTKIGQVGGTTLTLNSGDAIPVDVLNELHTGWFPSYTNIS